MQQIRKMEIEDLPSVIQVHIKSFPGFFLSFLGPAFLSELYSSIVRDIYGISYVYIFDGEILGFVSGTAEPRGFYRRLMRKWWRFMFASFNPVIRNPKIIPRLFRALLKPQQTDSRKDVALLMSIAVLPERQGEGAGKQLIKAFLNEAYSRGIKTVELATDQENNDYANRFYQKLGFEIFSTYITPEGRKMNEYKIDVNGMIA
jgi:ribosomal protein S18 acetylase RimI-like enzyme